MHAQEGGVEVFAPLTLWDPKAQQSIKIKGRNLPREQP